MKFKAKDGMEYTIRLPEMSDAKALTGYINTLIEERPVGLPYRKKYTLKSEKDWLKGLLKGIRKNETVYYLAEKEGKIVASADLRRIGDGLDSAHLRIFGVTVLNEYRNKGLGTQLTRMLIEWAKKKKIDFIELSVYEKNPDAKRLYERLGFKEVAVIPKRIKRGKKYMDDIIMHLYLK